LLEPALNRYLDHRLRSEEGLARWDAAVEDLYLRGIYRHPYAPKRRGHRPAGSDRPSRHS
jgi:hypothetical protein